MIRELEKSVEIRESTILVWGELIGFPFLICNNLFVHYFFADPQSQCISSFVGPGVMTLLFMVMR